MFPVPKKTIAALVCLCLLSVLPWIGMSDFTTKGEPREATVALSMLESGNTVLPASYADEFAYKPPMAHWLMLAASLPQGAVTPFTARLPSALALIVLIGYFFLFCAARMEKQQEALIAGCLLLTCVEMHRAGMTTRVDMLLTTFTVLGLCLLYRWEEKRQLKGLPLAIPLLLSAATLTKGPVGLVLPLFVFGLYLLLLRYPFRTTVRALLGVGLASLCLPLLWYVAAWRQAGDGFLGLVLAENFGRFFHLDNLPIAYDLGHKNGAWYNLVTLLAGFTPWTLLALLSLFALPVWRNRLPAWKELWERLRRMDKLRLFCLVAALGILVFYSIPSSKRSVYLMPAYPFIALFLAHYIIYVQERCAKVWRAFVVVITAIAALAVLLVVLMLTVGTGWLPPVVPLLPLDALTLAILALLCLAVGWCVYRLRRRAGTQLFYPLVAVMLACFLLMDGVILRGERRAASVRPFAEQIMRNYPLHRGNVYVMNDLREYSNLYGLNFYMGNIFRNFGKEQPTEGYFLAGEKDMEKVMRTYADRYTFQRLTSTPHAIKEMRQPIVLSRFRRIP